MTLKLFTDPIDALGKVAGGLKAIVDLPKAERAAMRRTLDETCRVLGAMRDMASIRLGDMLLHAAGDAFPRDAARLQDRKRTQSIRAALVGERRQLIKQELALYMIV